jgi:hypothetical protein
MVREIGLVLAFCAALTACVVQTPPESPRLSSAEDPSSRTGEGRIESPRPTSSPAMAADQILVKFREGTDTAAIQRIGREAGLRMIKVVSPPNLLLMSITDGSSVDDAMARLKAFPEVLYSEPNYTRSLKGD